MTHNYTKWEFCQKPLSTMGDGQALPGRQLKQFEPIFLNDTTFIEQKNMAVLFPHGSDNTTKQYLTSHNEKISAFMQKLVMSATPVFLQR